MAALCIAAREVLVAHLDADYALLDATVEEVASMIDVASYAAKGYVRTARAIPERDEAAPQPIVLPPTHERRESG
jgi:hypothetical protein